jgi:rubrerythrin
MEYTILEREKRAPTRGFFEGIRATPFSKILENSIKQYLYFAFRRSLRDAESYKNAASSMPDDDRFAFLMEMAQRKQEEAEKLYGFYKSDGFHVLKNIHKRSIISIPHYQAAGDFLQITSMEETYVFALKKEQNNFNLYSKLADLDNNPNTKILFQYLSQLCLNHVGFIERKLSCLNNRIK